MEGEKEAGRYMAGWVKASGDRRESRRGTQPAQQMACDHKAIKLSGKTPKPDWSDLIRIEYLSLI